MAGSEPVASAKQQHSWFSVAIVEGYCGSGEGRDIVAAEANVDKPSRLSLRRAFEKSE
jgi:hypothetical protein